MDAIAFAAADWLQSERNEIVPALELDGLIDSTQYKRFKKGTIVKMKETVKLGKARRKGKDVVDATQYCGMGFEHVVKLREDLA